MNMSRSIIIAVLFLIAELPLSAQTETYNDPCGVPDSSALSEIMTASGNWGYGYDTLLYDLSEWEKNPFVTVDSAGSSVQGRTLFVMTIQDTTADTLHLRQRIWIHARTHPGEVQGTWVTNEMIKYLLADNDTANTLRRRYVFNIMPMYNPDGVEIGLDRENANGIDIEGNWNAGLPEKEVVVLRGQFQKFMAQPNPMKIMLNMHSAYACKRYFVYHALGGTSQLYTLKEQRFINYIRSNFLEGFEPFTYYISWVNGTALQYPESWCWLNHKEKIMAMTYEDGNCISASDFGWTARAIVRGIDRYLQDTTSVLSVVASAIVPDQFLLNQNYPNPFNPTTVITYQLSIESDVIVKVYDMLGREIAVLVNGREQAGTHSVAFNASAYSSGVYFYRLISGGHAEVKTMHYVK